MLCFGSLEDMLRDVILSRRNLRVVFDWLRFGVIFEFGLFDSQLGEVEQCISFLKLTYVISFHMIRMQLFNYVKQVE